MNLEEMRRKWQEEKAGVSPPPVYDAESFATVVKTRSKNSKNIAMRYFWGSFTFHLIVYAFLAHVMIRFGDDTAILMAGGIGFAIMIPFTAVMMKRFKKLALMRLRGSHTTSIQTYVEKQYGTLAGFFSLKKRYEWFLIPLQCIIGVFITFRILLPGGVAAHPIGAFIIFAISLWSCVAAIRMENRRSFETPLQDLQRILDDYKSV